MRGRTRAEWAPRRSESTQEALEAADRSLHTIDDALAFQTDQASWQPVGEDGEVPASLTPRYVPVYECTDCEVQWSGTPECWSCGTVVKTGETYNIGATFSNHETGETLDLLSRHLPAAREHALMEDRWRQLVRNRERAFQVVHSSSPREIPMYGGLMDLSDQISASMQRPGDFNPEFHAMWSRSMYLASVVDHRGASIIGGDCNGT